MYNSLLLQNSYLNGLHSAGILHFLEDASIRPLRLISCTSIKDPLHLTLYNPHQSINYQHEKDTNPLNSSLNKTPSSNTKKEENYTKETLPILYNFWESVKLINEPMNYKIYKKALISRTENRNFKNSSTKPQRNLSLRSSYMDNLSWLITTNKYTANKIAASQLNDKKNTVEEKSSELKSWFTSFGAGFLAGTVARTSTAPFDRLKFIYQLYYKGSDKPPSLTVGFREIIRRDGFRGLFRGNLMCVLKASPETSIRLTIFEKLKSLIKDEKTGKLSKNKLFLAGGLSGAIANFAIFPLDAMRTRLAAAPSGVYNGVVDAMTKIIKTEGSVRSLYRGLSAAMIANLPTSGLNLAIYESLKEWVSYQTGYQKLPSIGFMIFGGISALLTCSLLYPLQVVTSRLVMQSLLDKENQNKGMMHQIRKIYKSEGVSGFYKGYSPALSKVVLGNAVSFGCFEFMKKALGIEFKKH